MTTDVTFRGHTVTFNVTDPEDHIQKHWLRGVFYEQGMLEFIYDHKDEIGTDGLWIDVGAYVGNHSVFFKKICDCGTLAAYEPLFYKDAYSNFDTNDVYGTVYKFAISDIERRYLAMERNGGMSKIVDGDKGDVLTATLDDLAMTILDVKLIKIDVEGHEQHVLRGAKETLTQNDPWVFVEVIDGLEDVDAIMDGYGYHRTEHVFNHTPTYLYRK